MAGAPLLARSNALNTGTTFMALLLTAQRHCVSAAATVLH